jgi:hypothetical protein
MLTVEYDSCEGRNSGENCYLVVGAIRHYYSTEDTVVWGARLDEQGSHSSWLFN